MAKEGHWGSVFVFSFTAMLALASLGRPLAQEALTPAEFSHLAQEALEQASQNGTRVSFAARSVRTGEWIVEHDSERLLNPASNVKLVTSAAALTLLGPDHRFKTEFYANGSVQKGVLKGDLIVKGYGDPTVTWDQIGRAHV